MTAPLKPTIDDMINDLNGIQQEVLLIGSQTNVDIDVNNAGDLNVSDGNDGHHRDLKHVPLDKSQISVQSIDCNKIVINLNLNKSNDFKKSSICDTNDRKSPEVADDEAGGSRRSAATRFDSNHSSSSGSAVGNGGRGRSHSTGANNDSDNYNSGSSSDCISGSSGGDGHYQPHNQSSSNQSFKNRLTRRTISESSTNEVTHRGILKYTRNWVRRTVSESSCDGQHIDGLSDVFNILSDIQSCTSFESDINHNSDDDYDESGRKTTKNVHFAEQVSKTVFRPTSSILGRKLKNQKRAKARKLRKNSLSESSEAIDGQKSLAHTIEIERSRQDSGYDSEDNNNGHNRGDDNDGNKAYNKSHENNNSTEIVTGIENLVFE